ncbi:MAG: C25 family cysteine peptidase [Armatimonadota bacterium]
MTKRILAIPVFLLVCLFCTIAWGAQLTPGVKIQPNMVSKMSQIKLAGNWIPSRPGGQITLPSRLNILAKSNQTTLQVDIPGFASEDITGPDGTVYQQLTIPNGGHTAELGKPELATVSTYVEVPTGMKVKVSASPVGEAVVHDNYLIWPSQKQGTDRTGSPDPKFEKDEAAYRLDAFVPTTMVGSSQPAIIRGVSMVNVTIVPMQYNAAKKQLKSYSKISITVEFTGTPIATWQQRRTKYATPEFAASFKNIVPSYAGALPKLQANLFAGIAAVIPNLELLAADYLIICPQGWETAVQPLAAWRESNGMLTKIVTLNNIPGGITAQNIANYIKNAYENWSTPPSYLLLVGDANLLPTFYRTTHPDSYETAKKIGTDLYYATVDGTDMFPDIAYGRIVASSSAQATMMINKVINYEKTPPAGAWNNKVLVASGYQAGRYFHITSDAIAAFLQGKGYGITKVYKGGSYTGTGAQATAAINNGVFLVTHRDHGDSTHGPYGGSDGWSEPGWYSAQASTLTNGGMLPVVFTLNCRTGWFDDETDQDTQDPGGNCLTEALVRNPNGGAVAAVGASRISFSGYNDELARGFMDAIWPDFDPAYSGGAPASGARLGQVLNAGKIWMYDKYVLSGGGSYPWEPDPVLTLTEFEIIHLFGDPAMRMWTSAPGPALSVTMSKLATGGKIRVIVKAGTTPISNALVVLQLPNAVRSYRKGVTNSSGVAEFTVANAEQAFVVTASKWSSRPFQGQLTAQSPATIKSPNVVPALKKTNIPKLNLPD